MGSHQRANATWPVGESGRCYMPVSGLGKGLVSSGRAMIEATLEAMLQPYLAPKEDGTRP